MQSVPTQTSAIEQPLPCESTHDTHMESVQPVQSGSLHTTQEVPAQNNQGGLEAADRRGFKQASQRGRKPAEHSETTTIALLPNEYWWGGAVSDGRHMPYGTTPFTRDLAAWHETPGELPEANNQVCPLLVSTKGRYVWCDEAFTFSFNDATLCIEHRTALDVNEIGACLADAYRNACKRHFPPTSNTISFDMIEKPQYNTWIEMPYHPTQEAVEHYAQQFVDSGMPPGIIMIDDKWSIDYGNWTFDKAAFPDPAGMIERLHNAGFRVMLWVVPFISPDSESFRLLEKRNLLIRDHTGNIAIRRWWNGLSAVLDLSNPRALEWMHTTLNALCALGVDGFKFDGADFYDFHSDDITFEPLNSQQMCERWSHIATQYPFNEMRACWKMAGKPLAQRLQDKPPSWDEDGIGSLIPEMLAQSMIGHAIVCPDMIGGGEVNAMSDAQNQGFDQEFFVRYAQLACLCPMMQFSVAPARVLDEEHLAAVMKAITLREEFLPLITSLADQAARTGAPIMRPMAYHYPGLESVNDQFLLGEHLLVAPVTQQGATSRTVHIPHGSWRSDTGEVVHGPATITIITPLDRLPYFVCIETTVTRCQ